ncbi:hypothetical protein, partial [Fundidesulfovibrio agrisoli]|uniref:hypothetical protein n=1 Tax=Fundidesulfovibrio agrisoli TaxID=2922717 RepID=UPI001FAC4920
MSVVTAAQRLNQFGDRKTPLRPPECLSRFRHTPSSIIKKLSNYFKQLNNKKSASSSKTVRSYAFLSTFQGVKSGGGRIFLHMLQNFFSMGCKTFFAPFPRQRGLQFVFESSWWGGGGRRKPIYRKNIVMRRPR